MERDRAADREAGRAYRLQSVRSSLGPILGSIFRFFSEIDCVILEVSVGMRAPFAPHMSFGSRATQAKPEALPSCSGQNKRDRADVSLSYSKISTGKFLECLMSSAQAR